MLGPVCGWNSKVSESVSVSSAYQVTACSFPVHMFSVVTFRIQQDMRAIYIASNSVRMSQQ